MESAAKTGAIANARKKSLPDISNIDANDPKIMSREAIAILSSQRREAIRRQEEEAERLRANPLLYLLSPEVWVGIILKAYHWEAACLSSFSNFGIQDWVYGGKTERNQKRKVSLNWITSILRGTI